jgi:hypothetical protein
MVISRKLTVISSVFFVRQKKLESLIISTNLKRLYLTKNSLISFYNIGYDIFGSYKKGYKNKKMID